MKKLTLLAAIFAPSLGLSCPVTIQESFEWFKERPKAMEANKITDLASLEKRRFLDFGTQKLFDEDLKYLCPLKNIDTLLLYQDHVGYNLKGTTLEVLTHLPKLVSLDLDGNNIKATELHRLCGSKTLEEVSLYKNPLGAEGLGSLACLPAIKSFFIQGSKRNALTDSELVEFVEYRDHAGLETLGLVGNKITDDGLKHLEGLPVKVLSLLGNTLQTGEGLQYIGGLPRLEVLSLGNNWAYSSNTNVIDAKNLVHLAHSQTLKVLDLSFLDLEDVSFVSKIPKLNEVYLTGNKLDAEDLRGFLQYESFKLIVIGEKVAKSDHEVVKQLKEKFGDRVIR